MVVVVEPSAVSFATVSSTVMDSPLVALDFTVNVLLLLAVPVMVIKSLTAKLDKLVDVALMVLLLAVNDMSVPVMFTLWSFWDDIVVLDCAIVIIYRLFSV
jgi:hypothetical protein